MMRQVSLMAVIKARMLPNGHVGVFVRNLAEPSFDQNQPEFCQRPSRQIGISNKKGLL